MPDAEVRLRQFPRLERVTAGGAYIVLHVCATAWGSGNRAPSEAATWENNVAATRDLWSVRIGEHCRALGTDVKEGIYWIWIGPHAEYDRIVA